MLAPVLFMLVIPMDISVAQAAAKNHDCTFAVAEVRRTKVASASEAYAGSQILDACGFPEDALVLYESYLRQAGLDADENLATLKYRAAKQLENSSYRDSATKEISRIKEHLCELAERTIRANAIGGFDGDITTTVEIDSKAPIFLSPQSPCVAFIRAIRMSTYRKTSPWVKDECRVESDSSERVTFQVAVNHCESPVELRLADGQKSLINPWIPAYFPTEKIFESGRTSCAAGRKRRSDEYDLRGSTFDSKEATRSATHASEFAFRSRCK